MKGYLKEKWFLFQLKTKQDPEAFGQLYDLYVSRIYRFIYFKVPSALDAEDLTAEVFLKAWAYIKEQREIEKFGGLLYKIARNLVIDFYRRKTIKAESIDEFFFQKLSDAGAAAEKMAKAGEAVAIIKAIQFLKEEYREVLTLRFIDGLEISEIAEILEKSNLNVRILTHRALKVLRKIFNQQIENPHV